MTPAIRVRDAEPADAPAVAAIEDEAFGAEGWASGLVQAALLHPRSRVLVAEVDGAVVAHLAARAIPDAGEILTLAVDPHFRRQGLARALLEATLAWLRDTGATEVHLEVEDGNAGARAFYRGAGFAEVGRRRDYYGAGRDAILMACPLPGA